MKFFPDSMSSIKKMKVKIFFCQDEQENSFFMNLNQSSTEYAFSQDIRTHILV